MEKQNNNLPSAPEGKKWGGELNPETRRVDLVLLENQPNLEEISNALDLIDADSKRKVNKPTELSPENKRKNQAREIYDESGVLVLGKFGDMNWGK